MEIVEVPSSLSSPVSAVSAVSLVRSWPWCRWSVRGRGVGGVVTHRARRGAAPARSGTQSSASSIARTLAPAWDISYPVILLITSPRTSSFASVSATSPGGLPNSLQT